MKTGIQFVTAINKVECLGVDTVTRFNEDSKGSVFLSILKTRDAFIAATHAFKESRDSYGTTQELVIPVEDGEPDYEKKVLECEVEMWDIKTTEVFDEFVGSSVIMDLVAHWSTALTERLSKACQKVATAIQGVTGQNLWKKEIVEESTLEDVVETAKSKLKIQKALTFMNNLDAFSEDFISWFDHWPSLKTPESN